MKKTYKLIDLDCANCALKMEHAINRISGIEAASVSFMQQKMTIDFSDGADVDKIMGEVVHVIHKVEPDCEVIL
ncbi:MAG: heavy-metal-associated domain-containing protein [Clostridia bacterium]|nr:heavy-metal-associated domain-containing protein [Clostridia bacterium]